MFITTRHDSHAQYVKSALEAGKHVFVEKPLCLTEEELNEIQELCAGGGNGCQLMVGFNRRFAPYAIELKKRLGDGPVSVLYRINAGSIPGDSWIQDKQIGGGRIIGEACHFIDLLTWLCGALPRQVHAVAIPDPNGLNDTVSINLQFANGSIGSVSYFSNGSKEMPKEYIEAYSAGFTGVIRDFKALELYSKGKPDRSKTLTQDKGQAAMLRAFIKSVKEGASPPIPTEEVIAVTRATFAVLESLRTHQAVSL
ncbi:MAG: Gfo/Idh/MocA family protein [Planctomycetota bacterium]